LNTVITVNCSRQPYYLSLRCRGLYYTRQAIK